MVRSAFWIFIGCLAAASAGPTATAQPADDRTEYTIIFRPEVDTAQCHLAVAEKITLEALAADPDRWLGKCVAVDGYWAWRALFRSKADLRLKYPAANERLEKRRVGIYASDEIMDASPKSPRPYTAVGVAGTCECLAQGALMVMGYCHYTGGAYIAVSQMRPRTGGR